MPLMRAKREKIKEQQLAGFKYFKILAPLLESLHNAGCEHDRAGNRQLHMDQYMALILLYMFNPICTSLRALQQASELKKVQQKLGVGRASLGSLSESARVFDSSRLKEIVETLSDQLEPVATHRSFQDLPGVLTAVDGTLINALSKMFWAIWKKEQNAIKAHVQFDLEKYVPIQITVTDGNGSEKRVLEDSLEAGRIYVIDRGYAKFALLQQIAEAKSFFVCRLNDNAAYERLQEKPLSAEAKEAGILWDRVVRLGRKTKNDLQDPVRLVSVKCTPHRKRYKIGRGGPEQGESLLIATNLLDEEPEVISLIFQHRWSIEIFFRFFKHILGCRHLLSYCQNGVELQTYAAIIACMLISLWTGRKPTLRTYEMLCWYFTGMADEEELLAHIGRLQKQEQTA